MGCRRERLLPERAARASGPLGTTHAVLTTRAARTPTSPASLCLVSTPHPGQGLHFELFSPSSALHPPRHTYAEALMQLQSRSSWQLSDWTPSSLTCL